MESSRIEELRALAFASLPSTSKRALVPSSNAELTTIVDATEIFNDKEEGELSSDEEMLGKLPGNLGHGLVHGMSSLHDNDQHTNRDTVTPVLAPILETPHAASHHEDLPPLETSVNHGQSSRVMGSSFSCPQNSVPMDPACATSNVMNATFSRESPFARFSFAALPLVKERTHAADISSYSLASATSVDLPFISSNSMVEMSVSNNSRKAGWVLPSINAPATMSTLCTSFPSDSKDNDAFVIKFSDGDSDSDEEQQHPVHENSPNTSIGPEKAVRLSKVLNNNISVPQQNFSSSQVSTRLRGKFVDMNIQHVKAKARHSSNAGKLSRRFYNTVLARKPIGSSMKRTSKIEQNLQAVSDLEALRQKIAAKESELQQQRQLLAIKEHESKGGLTADKRFLAANAPTASMLKTLPSSVANNMHSDGNCSTHASLGTLPGVANNISCLTSGSSFAGVMSSGGSLFADNVLTKELNCSADSVISSTVNSQLGSFSIAEAQLLQTDCNSEEFFSKQDVSIQFKQLYSREALSVSESMCRPSIANPQNCQLRESVPSFGEMLQNKLSVLPIMGDFETLALNNGVFRSAQHLKDDTYLPCQKYCSNFQMSDFISSKNEKVQIDQEMSPPNRLTCPFKDSVVDLHGRLPHSSDTSGVSDINSDIKMGRPGQSQGILLPSCSLSMSDSILLTENTQELNVASCIQSTTCIVYSEGEPLINKRWHEEVSQRDPVKRMKVLLKEDCNAAKSLPAISIDLVRPMEGPNDTVDVCRFEDDDSRENNVLLSQADGRMENGHHGAVNLQNIDTCEDQKSSLYRPLSNSRPLKQHMSSTLHNFHIKDNQALLRTVHDGQLLSQAKNVSDYLQLLLEQLKIEEEVLDQQLEVAQQNRHMCEIQERLSWKAYREARDALAKANLECELHFKKRESLYVKRRETQNKHQLAKYFIEAPDAFKSPVTVNDAQNIFMQGLPLAKSDDAEGNTRLSAHDTQPDDLNKFQDFSKDKRISQGMGTAIHPPTASKILSSPSFKVGSSSEVSRSHGSQMSKKTNENVQCLVSQHLVETKETNLDPKGLFCVEFSQDLHLQGCPQADAMVQDDCVKAKPCKVAQEDLNEENDYLMSMRGMVADVSSKSSRLAVDTTEGTSKRLKASCQSCSGLFSQTLGSGMPSFQQSLMSNMKIPEDLYSQTGFPEEQTKSNMNLLSYVGQGHMRMQPNEPVEEYPSLKYISRSYSLTESGVKNVDDPVKFPFVQVPVSVRIQPQADESPYATMEQTIMSTAARNLTIAFDQDTVGKLKHHVDPVALKHVEEFSHERTLLENCQESQAGLQKEDYYQPTNSDEELFSPMQKERNRISECCVSSSGLSLVFCDSSWKGLKQQGMAFSVSQRKGNVQPDSLTKIPPFAGCETSLSSSQIWHTPLFRAAGADSSLVSSSLRSALDPLQPLCKFEHRGKCNDDHCRWQHQNQTTSISQKAASCNSRWKDYVTQVPIYRISNHVMRNDMDAFTCLKSMIQRCYKHQNYDAHFLSLSCQRLIPYDMPCLLESLKCLSWWDGNHVRTFEMSSRRHSGDDFERRACIQHVAREPGDVEAWLDLALSLSDYDLRKLDSNTEKDVLFVLSRALEANPASVSLWMVYLHTFYRHQKGFGLDNMFDHAVKLNSGSYELWLLYIHSRFGLRERLDAYEVAIRAIGRFPEETELKGSDRSCQMLDLALQSLHCMCISEQIEDALSWINDLCFDASERVSSDRNTSKRGSTRILLTALHPGDACILWISCAYVLVCHQLPMDVIRRLGCKQVLLYSVNWLDKKRAQRDISGDALHLFAVAASSGLGCLDLQLSSSTNENTSLARQSFATIYLQYLAVVKGPEESITLGQRFQSQFPTCVELVVLCARIKQQYTDDSVALKVFEEALIKWPNSFRVSMCLWNQYAGHALEWKGKGSAWSVLRKCALYIEESKQVKNVDPSFWFHLFSSDIVSSQESVSHSEIVVIRRGLQSMCYEERTALHHDTAPAQETAFALLNLAFIEMLSDNFEAADSIADKVIELPLDGGFGHFWKEYLNLKFLVTRGSKPLYETLISLCDKSYLCAQLLPKPNSLSKHFLESFKKRRVCGFFEDLLISPSSDSSMFNSILETCFGPALLPKELPSLVDWLEFFGGLLEFCPSNVELALSVCRVIFQNTSPTAQISYVAAAFWAGSMLAYSLIHSHPLAPEGQWVEAGILLEGLGLEEDLQQFYRHAFLSYPFSAALWRSFIAFNSRYGNRAMAVQAAKDRGLDL